MNRSQLDGGSLVPFERGGRWCVAALGGLAASGRELGDLAAERFGLLPFRLEVGAVRGRASVCAFALSLEGLDDASGDRDLASMVVLDLALVALVLVARLRDLFEGDDAVSCAGQRGG